MSKNIIVIGGGIIGLCSAYYLQKEGHQVTIIDQSNLDAGASYVNAGYLSPSHLIPLSAPGVMKKGLKWMFNPASPLYIKPRLDADFLKWTWAFNKSCNSKHVAKAAIDPINDPLRTAEVGRQTNHLATGIFYQSADFVVGHDVSPPKAIDTLFGIPHNK